MLLQSLVFFGLHFGEGHYLIHFLVTLCKLLLKATDFLSLLCEGGANFLETGIVLADHLLQLFLGIVGHVVQIKGNLLCLSLLYPNLVNVLIVGGLARS